MNPRLCLVTDRRRLAAVAGCPLAEATDRLVALAGAAAADLDLLQVREPDLEAGALVTLTRALVAATAHTRCRVVVNDRLDVALAAGAAGVHLKATSPPATEARRLLPPGALVGRSVHDGAEAAAAGPVDYLIAGTLHPSQSKGEGGPTLGYDGLAAIVRRAAVPVLAIGGVEARHWPAIRAAGGAGLAGIGLFLPSAEAWRRGDAGAGARAVRSIVDSPPAVP
jgi:thiamine-phosphate pyrophosphorylase